MHRMVRRLNGMAAGGRGARRLFFVAVVLLGVLPSAQTSAASGDQANHAVTVREDGGLFLVEARFTVPQRAATVLTVLTDYEGIPRFLPDVRRSAVLERGNGRAVVEQEAQARFMLFSRQIYLTLDVVEEPGALRFRDRCGKSFTHYEGSWQVRDQRGGAAITYWLSARPSFAVPEFVLKRLLKRDATQMIERLRIEIAARQHQP